MVNETPAYITVVTEEHTIVVPPELPAGTTVAVVAMPSSAAHEAARRARFDATLQAIREIMGREPQQTPPNEDEVDTVIERARKRQRP